MKYIIETIKSYVTENDTDYAILINGAWGSGKTHFWKNTLEKEIISLATKNEKLKSYKLIYVSLYGLDSTKMIRSKIISGYLPQKFNENVNIKATISIFKQLFNTIKKVLKLEIDADTNTEIVLDWILQKDIVLCFDDVERSKIRMKELLGYINTFVEHKKIKTIMIANENEINAEEKEEYTKYKEKLIGYTLEYQPDFKFLFNSVIDMYKNDNVFYPYLTEYNELILNHFKNSQTSNIRSLKYALSRLFTVYKYLNSDAFDNSILLKTKETLINLIMPLSFEYKCSNDELIKILKTFPSCNAFNFSVYYATQSSVYQFQEDNPIKKYLNKYYSHIGYQTNHLKSAFEYITTGFFNFENFKLEILEYVKEVDNQHIILADKLRDYKNLGNTEFKKLLEDVLTYVYSGKYLPFDYIQLYKYYDFFLKNNLLNIPAIVFKDKFQEGFKNSLNNNKYEEFDIEHFAKKLENGNDDINYFIEYIKKTLSAKNISEENEKAGIIIEKLINNPEHFFDIVFDKEKYSNYKNIPFLKYCNAELISDKIIYFSNAQLNGFLKFITDRYNKDNPLFENILSNELPNLMTIKEKIKNRASSRKDHNDITEYNFKLIVDKIESLEPQTEWQRRHKIND